MNYSIGLQMTLPLPEITAMLSQSRIHVGAFGEVVIAQELQRSGYRVDVSHEIGRGDLTVIDEHGQLTYIEVKTAKRGKKDGAYRFTLYKFWEGTIRTDYHGADFVVLLAVGRSGFGVPFVVPVADLGERQSLDHHQRSEQVSRVVGSVSPNAQQAEAALLGQKIEGVDISVATQIDTMPYVVRKQLGEKVIETMGQFADISDVVAWMRELTNSLVYTYVCINIQTGSEIYRIQPIPKQPIGTVRL